MPEAGVSGRDNWLHPTVLCGMQLLIRAWNIWHQGPHKCSHFKFEGHSHLFERFQR